MGALKNGPFRIATAVEGTAVPDCPPAGTAMTFSESWTELAHDLDSGDIAINKVKNALQIKGVLDQAPQGLVILDNYIESVGFPGYEIAATTFEDASTATASSWDVTEGTTATKLALIVECRGIGCFYFPSVDLEWTAIKGAVDAQAQIQYLATVYAYSGSAGGWTWRTFQ